jgi:hypothetical protein
MSPSETEPLKGPAPGITPGPPRGPPPKAAPSPPGITPSPPGITPSPPKAAPVPLLRMSSAHVFLSISLSGCGIAICAQTIGNFHYFFFH